MFFVDMILSIMLAGADTVSAILVD